MLGAPAGSAGRDEGALRVALREQDGRTILQVGAERVVTGAAGAYFLLPEEGKLLVLLVSFLVVSPRASQAERVW